MNKDDKINKSLEKRRAIKELDEALLELGLEVEGDFSFMESLAQEIESTYVSQQRTLSAQALADEMESYAKRKYEEYEGLPEKIIAAIPSIQRIQKWRKKKNWQKAIWDKCSSSEIFSNENRSRVLHKLLEKIEEKGDVQAIKIFLTMSGDYVEKSEVKGDRVQDIFREINEQLHRKK